MELREKQQILNNFPHIELSYEKKLHKKVQNMEYAISDVRQCEYSTVVSSLLYI